MPVSIISYKAKTCYANHTLRN